MASPSVPSRWLLLPCAVALSALAGCYVTVDQGQAMEADIVKLKADFASAQKNATDAAAKSDTDREKLRNEQDAAVKKIEGKIREVNDALDGLQKAARRTGADLSVQLDQQDKEVARLRGVVEEFQVKKDALVQSVQTVQQLTTDLQTRLAALEKKVADDEGAMKTAATAAQAAIAAQKKEAAELPTGKEDFYKLAKKKYDDEDFVSARDLFTQFIAKWKNEPLACQAQFWLAETDFHDKDFRKAGLEFQKVVDGCPKSEKAPDAELKVAECFLELGLTDDAKSFLQNVIDTYPKTSAAKAAEKKLSELKKPKAK
jgi:tol-pal system protein YbgF